MKKALCNLFLAAMATACRNPGPTPEQVLFQQRIELQELERLDSLRQEIHQSRQHQ